MALKRLRVVMVMGGHRDGEGDGERRPENVVLGI
jgi:hypothetical protein